MPMIYLVCCMATLCWCERLLSAPNIWSLAGDTFSFLQWLVKLQQKKKIQVYIHIWIFLLCLHYIFISIYIDTYIYIIYICTLHAHLHTTPADTVHTPHTDEWPAASKWIFMIGWFLFLFVFFLSFFPGRVTFSFWSIFVPRIEDFAQTFVSYCVEVWVSNL